jgi:hypothetical protein
MIAFERGQGCILDTKRRPSVHFAEEMKSRSRLFSKISHETGGEKTYANQSFATAGGAGVFAGRRDRNREAGPAGWWWRWRAADSSAASAHNDEHRVH